MTRILLGGWARSRALPPRVLVHDPDAAALDALEAAVPAISRASAREAATADVVFLALHPPALAAALADIRASLTPRAIVVSLAPKVPLAVLGSVAGTSRVVRMIPNAPSLVGQGYNPVAYSPGLDSAARSALSALFAPWGQAPEVDEPQLEAYAVLTGMGPTYFWYQWQALRDLAREFGLSPSDADAGLRSMVTGSLSALLDSGLAPAAVMDLVPVKPLAALEPGVATAYHDALLALHAKIRPAEVTTG